MKQASIGMLRKDGTPLWLYEILHGLITSAEQSSSGLAAITRGETPDGTGNPLGVALPSDVGAVLYIGPGPALKTDVNNFFWDDTNHYLGIGTSAPLTQLHVVASSVANMERIQSPTTITVTDAVSGGATTLTSASAGFANVAVGALIQGTGFTAGTTVTAKASSSSITVSNTVAAGTYTVTFSHITDIGYFVNGTATDIQIKTSSNLVLISSSAQTGAQGAGLRMASATSMTRTWCSLQAGIPGPSNMNLHLQGFNGGNGGSMQAHFDNVAFSTWSGTALTFQERVGINYDPFDTSGLAAASRPASLIIGDIIRTLPSTYPAATDPAPLILENTGQVASRHMLQIREQGAGASPNRAQGVIALAFTDSISPGGSSGSDNENGRILLYNGGTLRSSITSGGATGANSRITFRDSSDVRTYEFERFNLFADAVATSMIMTPNRIGFMDPAGSVLSRVAFSATTTVLSLSTFANIPAPVDPAGGSNLPLLMLVSSGTPGTILSGLTSAGNYYLISGKGAGKLYMSDANGVGSWATSLSGTYTFTAGLTGGFPTFQWPNDSSTPFMQIDDTAGNTLAFGVVGTVSGAVGLNFPAAGGSVVTTTATQTLSNKTVSQGVTSQSTDLTPVSVGATNVIASPSSGAFYYDIILFVTVLDAAGGTYQIDLGWTDANGAVTASTGAIALTATGRTVISGAGQRQSGAITFTRTLTGSAGSSKIRYFIRIH